MSARTARGVLAALLAVAAMLILLEVRGAPPGDALRAGAASLFGAPERLLSAVRTGVTERWGGTAADEARIAELEDQLAAARIAAGARAAQAESLAAAAGVPAMDLTGFRAVVGRTVAGSLPQELVSATAISVGTGDGATPGLAVLDLIGRSSGGGQAGQGGDPAMGVVGFVSSVGGSVSTVRLVTDPATRLAVRVLPSGELGVLQGTGTAASVTLLDPVGRMSPGDRVVTLGTRDAIVPAGLPLGTIAGISGSAADLTRAAQVRTSVDVSTLDRVAVLVPAPR